ncbi:1453_t:CDS:2, partial [Paraglomus brasilianum]
MSKRPFECLDSRFPPNKETLLCTPNKQNMHGEEVVCSYLDAMENLLKYNQVVSNVPAVWTKSLESYLDNALKKEGEEFKIAVMEKISGDEGNYFRLYCEKILIDLQISKRKYIVQTISSLFKFYETTFGKISFDWIESHPPAGKLTKSASNSGIMRGGLIKKSNVFHMEVSGPPSLLSDDTKKSLHTDILNLIAILLDHLDLSVEVATRIKVFSFQVIKYRITFYFLNMLNDGSFLSSELFSALFPFSFDARAKYKQILFLMGVFHNEATNQISLMQDLDLNVNRYEGKLVREVLRVPIALKDFL